MAKYKQWDYEILLLLIKAIGKNQDRANIIVNVN